MKEGEEEGEKGREKGREKEGGSGGICLESLGWLIRTESPPIISLTALISAESAQILNRYVSTTTL